MNEIKYMEKWVEKYLGNFVRLNTNKTKVIKLTRKKFQRVDINKLDLSLLKEKIYKPENQDLIKNPKRTTDKILGILFNKKFLRGKKSRVLKFLQFFREEIYQNSVKQSLPVKLIIPSLPFKCQNPTSTNHSPDFVDLGEYLFFAQLRDMIASVKSVYDPGLEVIVLCDGIVYSDIFLKDNIKKVMNYRENCRKAKNELNLENSVTLIDMADIIRKEKEFQKTRNYLKYKLSEWENNNSEIRLRLNSLRRGMLFNVPFPEFSNLKYFLEMTGKPLESLPCYVYERLNEAALKYASFLLTMSYLNVIKKQFPKVIRATVHPKDSPQLPINGVNDRSVVLPHNGVPVVYSGIKNIDNELRNSVKIKKYYKLLSSNKDIKAIHLNGDVEPFFYISE